MINLSIFGKPQAFRLLETFLEANKILHNRSLVDKLFLQLERLRPTMTDREVTKQFQISCQILKNYRKQLDDIFEAHSRQMDTVRKSIKKKAKAKAKEQAL
jgi:hypothetical protein